MKISLEQIAIEDARYNPRGVKFVYEGLGFTANKITDEPSHVTGQTLCEGLKQLALKKWGRLAMMVLTDWNVNSTRDFGEIVYLLIKHKWMSAQPADTIEDFDNVYDFKTAFKGNFKF